MAPSEIGRPREAYRRCRRLVLLMCRSAAMGDTHASSSAAQAATTNGHASHECCRQHIRRTVAVCTGPNAGLLTRCSTCQVCADLGFGLI